MRRPSIRTRIVLWFVVLSGSLLASSGLALYRFTERSSYEALDEILQSRAQAWASLVEYDEGRLEFEAGEAAAADPVAGAEPFRGFAIRADRDRTLVAISPSLADRDLPAAILDLDPAQRCAARTIELEPGLTVRAHAGRYPPRVEDGPVEAAPELLVLAVEDVAEVEARLARLTAALGLAAPVVLFLSVACGWFLSRRIVGPLAVMARTANEVQATEPSRRLPIRGTGDEIDQLAGALNDAFTRLESALERQARFTADAAHELRTPIAVVRTQAEVALRGERDGAEYREALRDIAGASIRIDETLEALLVLARADAGDLPGGTDAVDLSALAAEVAGAFAAEAAGRSIDLSVERAPGTFARGDAGQLRVVLRNLISNAVRYGQPEGRVTVRTAAADGEATIEVEDDGIGIPPEHLPHVFDRFRRVDDARSRHRGGSGLGLSIVQAIVRRHAGTVEVRSAPDRGSVFAVRLPSASRPPTPDTGKSGIAGDPPFALAQGGERRGPRPRTADQTERIRTSAFWGRWT